MGMTGSIKVSLSMAGGGVSSHSASRWMGQVRQCDPPRPRPSSPPGMLMTLIPLVRSMLWATIFGLSAYILYGLGAIPGANQLRDSLHNLGPVVVVFIAMLLPLLWLQLRTEQPE